jgi:hypothetical protein
MKKMIVTLLLITLIAFVVCVPSLHGIYTDEDVVFDPNLVGLWNDDDSKES